LQLGGEGVLIKAIPTDRIHKEKTTAHEAASGVDSLTHGDKWLDRGEKRRRDIAGHTICIHADSEGASSIVSSSKKGEKDAYGGGKRKLKMIAR